MYRPCSPSYTQRISMERYSIGEVVGEGAFSSVHRAVHVETGKQVALKRVRTPRTTREEGSIERKLPQAITREIMCLQALRSENVIRVLDVFVDCGDFVLVFEYMNFSLKDLLDKLGGDSIPTAIVKYVGYSILCGISECHKLGIMHRDLKPSNILLTYEGDVKISDFGLSRKVLDSDKGMYSHQIGTRWYRSPESLYGSRTYDERVDVWSAGVILAEMLNNGQPLFEGESDIDQLSRVVHVLGVPGSAELWPEAKLLPDYEKICFDDFDRNPLEMLLADYDNLAIQIIKDTVCYADVRKSAGEVLRHGWFHTTPAPATKFEFAAWLETALARKRV